MKTVFALTTLALATPALAQNYTTVPTMPAATFLDSLGVNAHNEYTDGDYRLSGPTLQELQYLGIHNVRDGVPRADWEPAGQGVAAIRYLMSNGIKFDLGTSCDVPVSTYMAQVDLLAKDFPHSIIAIEGTNEIDNFGCNGFGSASETSAEAYQAQLYNAVHADSLLPGVPVYDFTGQLVQGSKIAGRADYANTHPYPYASANELSLGRMQQDYSYYYAGNYPRVITEDGYWTLGRTGDVNAVDELTQAVGQLQVYFDAALFGTSKTYIYELKDAYQPGSNVYNTAGFFETVTGIPKQAAVAVHNLTSALSYFLPTGTASTAPVQVAITGAPANSHTLALTDASGGVLLFSWNEVLPWNVTTQTSSMPAPIPVTLKLAKACSSAYTFDPITNKVAAITAGPNGYTVGEEPYPIGLYCAK